MTAPAFGGIGLPINEQPNVDLARHRPSVPDKRDLRGRPTRPGIRRERTALILDRTANVVRRMVSVFQLLSVDAPRVIEQETGLKSGNVSGSSVGSLKLAGLVGDDQPVVVHDQRDVILGAGVDDPGRTFR